VTSFLTELYNLFSKYSASYMSSKHVIGFLKYYLGRYI
jgi:hypothetical protein